MTWQPLCTPGNTGLHPVVLRTSAVLLAALALVVLPSSVTFGAVAIPAYAPAHNKNSLIDLSISPTPGGVTVRAGSTTTTATPSSTRTSSASSGTAVPAPPPRSRSGPEAPMGSTP